MEISKAWSKRWDFSVNSAGDINKDLSIYKDWKHPFRPYFLDRSLILIR